MQNALFLIISLIFQISVSLEAHALALDSDNILVDSTGKLQHMTQYAALRACPRGTHLPSAREQALFAQSLGAKGVLELSQVDENAPPTGYYKVSARDPQGNLDVFYFSRDGYQPPLGPLGTELFWSSSSRADAPAGVRAVYVLMGEIGAVSTGDSADDQTAVRCAANP